MPNSSQQVGHALADIPQRIWNKAESDEIQLVDLMQSVLGDETRSQSEQ
jgi:hypothetical protein